jgi:hypothetical protein
MHGHARPVERKIRLWIAQQERNRRREAQLGRLDAHGDALGVGCVRQPWTSTPHTNRP